VMRFGPAFFSYLTPESALPLSLRFLERQGRGFSLCNDD